MALHVRNISAHTALKGRGGQNKTGNFPNELRVTVIPFSEHGGADPSNAKALSCRRNVNFGEFKRRCAERLNMVVTRIFTDSGGELDSCTDIKEDDNLVCTSGGRYFSSRQVSMQQRGVPRFLNSGGGISHASQSKRVIKRFQNAVWRAKLTNNVAKGANTDLPGTLEAPEKTEVLNYPSQQAIMPSSQVFERQRRRSTASTDLSERRLADKTYTKIGVISSALQNMYKSNFLGTGGKIVLSPESSIRMFWDMFVGILVVYYTIIVPARIAFDNASPSDTETLVDIGFNIVFIIDIFLNFRTAVKIDGVLIDDLKRIRNAYLKTWFFIDFISSIPFDLIFVFAGNGDGGEMGAKAISINKILKFFRIFKLLRMMRLTRILARIERYAKIDPSLIRLTKLVGILVSTWHMIACCYWYVAMVHVNAGIDTAWVPPLRILSSRSFSDQYAHAFFWAVVVTSGIGWDISPETPSEVYFTTVAIVTGLLMYAVIIGSASTLLSNLDVVQQERKRKLDEIRAYLCHRKVGKDLREEIFEFYEYLFSCNVNSFKESNVLSELPPSLQVKLNLAVNRQVVNSVPLFSNCSQAVLASVIEQLYQVVILPGEYACEQGNAGEEMYFIVRGRIQIIYEDEGGMRKELAIRKDGDFFGETALINNQPRSASAKALTYCDMLVLSRSGFEVIKEQHEGVFDSVEQTSTNRVNMVEQIRVGSSTKKLRSKSLPRFTWGSKDKQKLNIGSVKNKSVKSTMMRQLSKKNDTEIKSNSDHTEVRIAPTPTAHNKIFPV